MKLAFPRQVFEKKPFSHAFTQDEAFFIDHSTLEDKTGG
jgi:hypothetical protein